MRSWVSIIALVVIASAAIADSDFSPGVIDRKPTSQEKTPGNNIHSKTFCIEQSGQWFEGQGYAYCVLPYSDAGRYCKNSEDCIGHCTMPPDKKSLDGKALPKGRG